MISPVAHRYASALFGIASEEKNESLILTQFSELISMIAENNNLKQALEAPFAHPKEQEKALETIAKKAKWNTHFSSLLRLMAKRRRLPLISHVFEAFVDLVRRKNNEIHANVTSAKPLGKNDKKKIDAIISERTGATSVVLEEHVDDTLLGGLIVEVGSMRIDTSIHGRLRRLEQNLKTTNI